MFHLAIAELLVSTLWLLEVTHRQELCILQSFEIFLFILPLKAFYSIRSPSRNNCLRTNPILYSKIFLQLYHDSDLSILQSWGCCKKASAHAHFEVDLLAALGVLVHDGYLLGAIANVDLEVQLSFGYLECATACYRWIWQSRFVHVWHHVLHLNHSRQCHNRATHLCLYDIM